MCAQLSLLKNHTPPLSDKLRPANLGELLGQEQLFSKNSVLRKLIEKDKFGSLILWGPPGSGKTTLANVIAKQTKKDFTFFHASFNGIKDIKNLIEEAQKKIEFGGDKTIVFIDEIHRFNKTQQDALLKHIEQGIIILIGPTTENPSFSINSALLSRCSVYTFNQLENKDLEKIIDYALNKLQTNANQILIDKDAKKLLVTQANGDARTVLNTLETAFNVVKGKIKNCDLITKEIIKEILSTRTFNYDKNGEQHYNLLSVLQKSIRGSDVNAAIYWLAKMLESGADPLVILRRLIVIASEDIGLADPDALVQATATQQAVNFLGYPECKIPMSQLVIYLATCPKSNSAYKAIKKAQEDILKNKNETVPIDFCNATTKLMKDLGYNKNYEYDHNYKYNYAGQSFLPKSLKNKVYYIPGKLGFEKEVKKRIEFWETLKIKLKDK